MSEFNYLNEKQRYLNSIGRVGFDCKGVRCADCMLSDDNTKTGYACTYFEMEYPEKATELIRKWSEENPVVTNAEHVKEVLESIGYKVEMEKLISKCPTIKSEGYTFNPFVGCEYTTCKKCREWWDEPWEGDK